MSTAISHRGTAVENGWAVLMARLIDRNGASIRQGDVSAVRYSLFELDPCWPNSLNIVAGHAEVPLDVEEVLFNELQVDDVWAVDGVGYNFRHEFELGGAVAKAGFDFEARYQIILATGRQAIVRFYIQHPSGDLLGRG
jgi:hypothetical protein